MSVLVPARDEEANLPGLLRALAAQGADEILVFDDGLNGTGLDQAEEHGVRVLSSPRPEGWVGRNWPLWELARAAHGQVLVIT
ncbi:glycosyltransferase, partial [Escherichia coli]